MKRYNSLRKKIDKMEKAIIGSLAPFMAYLNKIERGYELRICFWDDKEGSGDKMHNPLIYQFSTFKSAEDFLLSYLQENKPMKQFVLFTNEDEIYE